MKIEKTTYLGEPALLFSAGNYEALMIPSVGANIVKLTHSEKNIDILRTPTNLEEFKERPQVYGLPLLFPPNRIEDGTYTVNGKTYNLPINASSTNNHIHGFIRTLPFNITKSEILEAEEAVEVEATFISDASNDVIFKYFPHEFICKLSYKLSKNGLEQKVSFTNKSTSPMPLMVGFHSAFNVPFHKESKREDYRLIISANERWDLNSRNLPTEKMMPLNEFEKDFRGNGMMPFTVPLDNCYTAKPLIIDNFEYHGAIITDTSKNIKVYYEVGTEYKHWTIWNSDGNVNFLCPEPQTCVINSPNLNLPAELTGFKLLPQGKTWSETCKIYVK